MIIAHSQTQRNVRSLEIQLAKLRRERAAERELIAAAREFLAAEEAADQLARRFDGGASTGTVQRRLAVVDRLTRARRRMRRATGIEDKPIGDGY